MGLGLIFYFFLWFFRYSAYNVWRKKIVFLVFFLSLLLLFLVINKESITEGGSHFLNRFLSIFEFSFGSRANVWEISFRAWQDRPVFGWGPESFSYVFYKYFKADYFSNIPEGMYFDYAHNKIFNLMVNSGILGVLSWLSVLAMAFYSLLKYSFLKKKLVLILSVFLVSYFFQSLSVFDTNSFRTASYYSCLVFLFRRLSKRQNYQFCIT